MRWQRSVLIVAGAAVLVAGLVVGIRAVAGSGDQAPDGPTVRLHATAEQWRTDEVNRQVAIALHNDTGVFKGLSSPFTAARYHSLAVKRETLPDVLEVTAWTEDGEIMGLQHKTLPIHGVQFHPESIATQSGHDLLANFLDLAGVKRTAHV